ncbi:hypothetical protein [Acidocella facilis]|uniref:hypothetical protein n=1 Tax=Acidocella facilis TaxID=525 RepID=UPI001F1BEA5F|nr:hypothetical protein [Acidocella facilis]
MEVALKNISHNERMSEETNCFSATIYVGGKKAGEASNHGHGGPTMIHPRELEQKIDAYAKTLPPIVVEDMTLEMNAELLIGDLLSEYLTRRDMLKAFRTRLLFTKAGQPEIYQVKLGAAAMAKARQNPAGASERLKADKILNFLPENEALALYSTAGT